MDGHDLTTLTTEQATRFWSKVDKSAGPDSCWTWMASLTPKGYGMHRWRRRTWRAHRMAYELAVAPIPADRVVCHTCDNPACCNPAHLWLGTPAENSADMVAKGRSTVGDRNPSRLYPDRRARGSGHGIAKLTEADVPVIRGALADGESRVSVARRFGVSPSTIWSLQRGDTWAHVTGDQPGEDDHGE